jgi:cytochrome P450
MNAEETSMLNQQTDNALAGHDIFTDPVAMRALFAQVRREDPLHWTQAEGYPGFWAVTKHADIMEVGRHNELFINAPQAFLRDNAEEETLRNIGHSGGYARTLINMDSPDHRVYRGLSQAWFMPANIRKLDGMIQQRATEMVDKLQQLGGSCDFINDIANWYPLRVIMTALNVPEVDHPMMLQLTQQFFAPPVSSVQGSRTDVAAIKTAAIGEFFGYFGKLVENRRANPTDDLSTLIAHMQIDGKPIGQMETLSYFVILATAGHDTTATSLSGGLLALMEHPEQMARLRADAALLNAAVEEVFRWVAPVRHFIRTATTDYTLRGQQIRKGDRVMLCFPSGGMDEEVFHDGERFLIDRTPNRHMAFGFGPHACLGQNLARAELKAFFKEFLSRVKEVELDGPVKWLRSNQVSGPMAMQVRYRLA